MSSFATHLECSRCQEDFPVDQVQQVCKSDGGPLLVRYDLRRVRDSWTKDAVRDRPATLWRYRELLPHEEPDHAVAGLRELGRELKHHRLSARGSVGLNEQGDAQGRCVPHRNIIAPRERRTNWR